MSDTIDVKVLFFAKSREIAGTRQAIISLDGAPIKYEDLLDKIVNQFGLELIKDNIVLALNEEYCNSEQSPLRVTQSNVIAVIPPLSGG